MTASQRHSRSPYTDQENALFREAVRELMAQRQWTQAQAAGALGIQQGSLSNFLSGRAAGALLARAICRVTGRTEQEILGGQTQPELTLDQDPAWPEAVKPLLEARELPDYVWHHVGTMPRSTLIHLETYAIHQLGRAWWASGTREDRDAAREAIVLDRMARTDHARLEALKEAAPEVDAPGPRITVSGAHSAQPAQVVTRGRGRPPQYLKHAKGG